MKLSQEQLLLTGQSESHLVTVAGSSQRIHQAVHDPFQRLKAAAAKAGFEIEIVSGFRPFTSQLGIWNQKAQGTRPLLDRHGKRLDFKKLSTKEMVYAILQWSALPGMSRHHWGTDIDVIDRKKVPKDYRVQLTPEEVADKGMFGPLHRWLDQHMAAEGFFRPYQIDQGGVQPERWHLSHGPTSAPLFESHSEALVRETLDQSQIALKQDVLAELPEIFDRFFKRVSHAPAA